MYAKVTIFLFVRDLTENSENQLLWYIYRLDFIRLYYDMAHNLHIFSKIIEALVYFIFIYKSFTGNRQQEIIFFQILMELGVVIAFVCISFSL